MIDYWPHLTVAAATLAATAATALHILLRKDDTKAAVGWLGLVWFSPLVGIVLYWLFGINRIRRQARLLFAGRELSVHADTIPEVEPAALAEALPSLPSHLAQLAELTEKITRLPLAAGNRIVPLLNGDEAYPSMLGAIETAERSVSLSSYIFDNDRWGKRFRKSLAGAVGRGAAVRVLIDSVGARYSLPPVTWGLRRDGVPVSKFMQSVLPWRLRYYNLRNHRKILVVDGKRGFFGGMNISKGNVLADRPRRPIQDTHFLIEGPAVSELQRVFADDWKFTTGETLQGEAWFPALDAAGGAVARGIAEGPDEDFDKLRLTLVGAVACARESIRIVTPYFLPDDELASGLRVAALRGVAVEIIIPRKSNLPFVHWAAMAGLKDFLSSGCSVHLGDPPFDHSKIVIIDGSWSLTGSANWDPRSLFLNFEFSVECYDTALASALGRIFEKKLSAARSITLGDLAARPLPAVVRDRLFRLFSPYL